MKLSKFCYYILLAVFLVPSISHAIQEKIKITMFIGENDSIAVARAIKELSSIEHIDKDLKLTFYTGREVRNNLVTADDLKNSDVIMVDFMKREFDDFLSKDLLNKKTDIYGLRCSYLASKLKKNGFKINLSAEKYFQPSTVNNLKNMIFMVLSSKGRENVFEPPFMLPDSGIFHPHTKQLFKNFEDYLKWYKNQDNFTPGALWTGIHTFRTSVISEKGKLEACIIEALENQGINVLPVFGIPPYHKSLENFFLDKKGRPRVHTIIGFAFRFLRGFEKESQKILNRINAPVFIPLEAHGLTIEQWKKSYTGISTLRTAWQVCMPEQNGAVEPTMVGGKSAVRLKGMTTILYDRISIPVQVEFLVKRIKAWHNLKSKSNKDKKLALLYWNHPPGKQGIGSSYLNCFRSIVKIAETLKNQGYQLNTDNLTEAYIQKRILLSGRNVGSWAPGELDTLIASKGVLRIKISQYKEWFAKLPADFQANVIDQWGDPENSNIMIKNGEIIIPMICLGNLIIMPQPARGFGEDPEKLYHDSKIYPHHQYIAFYLWLKKEFKVDAIISLGKHGTHEWLPGKQIGLSQSCPPEVLIQNIPNIYPYIVDNIGEGIQAKRRGRGVIIDHLIPPLKKGGAYMEYRKLTGMIDAFHTALQINPDLADEKLKSAEKLIKKLGIDKDLDIRIFDHDSIEKVEHYILELQETMIPYGHHTFGISPTGESLDSLTDAINEASPEIKLEKIKADLEICGQNELSSLVRALEGGYIKAGEGNDPVRNPCAIPTGKNFFGFNIDKVPSREAWKMGKKLSDTMIENYRKKHGVFPDKLGIILWSTELQRNEGAGVAAVFHLLGISPVWDKKDQVVDLKPIPGSVLNRPRIDVLAQCSGLFRDSYGKVIKLMDRAVKMAGALKDVENFIAINNKKIEAALIEKGYSKKDAYDLSQSRIFGPMPGAYSHAMQELIPNSGVWENDKEIADVFIHHSSFAYGNNIWGKPLQSAYKFNLQDIKMTMHTRSSNLYNMLDNDDMFAFLGGLSLAVKSQTGKYPETMVAYMQDGKNVTLEDLPRAIGKALRTRYLNPEWIKGMKKEGYAGAKAMDEFVEHLWGFQVTSPNAVDKTYWSEIHDVYIKDKYNQNLKEFFDKNNPWALQSISARMLEADRKNYWKPSEKMKQSIATTFAVNVIEKGVACCEHTCNNPMFLKYVTSYLSLAGLLSPEQMQDFKMTMAKASGKTMEELVKEHWEMRESLVKTIKDIQKDENPKAKEKGNKLEGFEMVEEKDIKTNVTSSGSAWQVMVIVISIMLLLLAGYKYMKI